MPIPYGDTPSPSRHGLAMDIPSGYRLYASQSCKCMPASMSHPCGDVPVASQYNTCTLVMPVSSLYTLKVGISISKTCGEGPRTSQNGGLISMSLSMARPQHGLSMAIQCDDAPSASRHVMPVGVRAFSTSQHGISVAIQCGDVWSTSQHGVLMPIRRGDTWSTSEHGTSMSIQCGDAPFISQCGRSIAIRCKDLSSTFLRSTSISMASEDTPSKSKEGRIIQCRESSTTSQHWRTISIPSEVAVTIQKGDVHEFSSLDEAFNALRGSEQLISVNSLIWILSKCTESKNLGHAMYVYLHLCDYGLENYGWLVDHIVPMFLDCGSVVAAEHAIFRSVDCNEYSWTLLVQGFIECGELQHALRLYDKMQRDQVCPSKYTHAILLKAFGRHKCVEKSHQLHTEIVMRGFETETFVGNSLVRMYCGCLALQEAQKVFDKISVRDIVSWNSLLVGYCDIGQTRDALEFLNWMESQGICPDYITYTCSIRACGNKGSIINGRCLHIDVIKKGFEQDNGVSSTLVNMYAKCGALQESRYLFVHLSVHDIVSCNAVMVGCVERGKFCEALNLLDEMEKYNLSADCSTYACCLKACGTMRSLDNGHKIHIDILKKGYESDDYVSSTLVAMYSKCGVFVEAHKVFDDLPIRDLVTWTALIGGHIEYGLAEEALVCFYAMQSDGVCPCELLFANILKACSSIGALDKGRELHVEIVKKGFEKDSFIGSIMVDMYANCGSLLEARHVFEKFVIRDTVLWTSLISGYVQYGFANEALKLLDYMQTEDVFLDATVLACGLQACGAMRNIERGQQIHSEIIARGFEHDQTVSSIAIDMYAKCGAITDAKMMFDKHSSCDLVSWNTIISAYASHGFTERALYLFQDMQTLNLPVDAISWNSVIAGYADHGESKMAFTLFAQMQEQGMLPNDIILLSILRACGDISCLEVGRRTHARICCVDGGIVFNQLNLTTTTIEMYSKCGDMAYAQELLDATEARNVGMWDALIRGYARQMEFPLVFCSLRRMRTEGIEPDGILFLNILNVCSHLSLVDAAEYIFQAMIKEFCISPTIKHYTCIVDLLGRAGRLHEVVVMIEKTCSLQENSVVWCMVLDACRKWKNVEVGRWAFDRAVKTSEVQDCAPFILMSNIYADAGLYDEAKEIQSMMV